MYYAYPTEEFQFHKGTIKTPVISAISLEDINFNSIKVRLKHGSTIYDWC